MRGLPKEAIHPLVLGQGQRLFPGAGPSTAWRLTSTVPTSTGVVIANYELNAPVPP